MAAQPRRKVTWKTMKKEDPEWAALLMSVSSIVVATNAVLLKCVEGELTAL